MPPCRALDSPEAHLAWQNSDSMVVQVARVNKMLGDEYGTASNIKSRVNRLSVLSAITSTQQVCPKAKSPMPC